MPVNIQISVQIDNESIMLLERLCLKTQSTQYNTGNRYSGNRYSGNNYTSNSYIGNNYTSNSYSETSYSGNSSVQTKSLFNF